MSAAKRNTTESLINAKRAKLDGKITSIDKLEETSLLFQIKARLIQISELNPFDNGKHQGKVLITCIEY